MDSVFETQNIFLNFIFLVESISRCVVLTYHPVLIVDQHFFFNLFLGLWKQLLYIESCNIDGLVVFFLYLHFSDFWPLLFLHKHLIS